MRRIVSPLLALMLLGVFVGTASAAPTRTATLWGCLRGSGSVQVTADWDFYHPDTLWTVATVTGDPTVYTYPTPRSVDWKFGTSTYDMTYDSWLSGAGLTFTPDTYLSVRLYHRDRFLAETNSVRYGDLLPC